MRLRLVHSLSLLLVLAVALSVAAMGGVMALNLRRGFAGYLLSRDVEQLDKLVEILGRQLAAQDPAALREGQVDLRASLEVLARQEGIVAPVGPGPAGRPPPHDGALGARVELRALDGSHLAGPRLLPGAELTELTELIEREVRAQGQPVARLVMRRGAPVPNDVETRFLRSQYLGILAVAAGMLALALGGAWWFARRWTRPLREVQLATSQIAQGQLETRLASQRTDEVGDVMRNIDGMAASLQRLDRARRRWLAELSHELRTPLTVLRGELEALADGIRPLDARAVASLRDEVQGLTRLVEDLHLLAMSDLQALPCHFAELDAAELAAEVLTRFAARAQAAGLTLTRAERWPAQEVMVTWDGERVTQVLGNLLENSLRYTDAPGQIRLALTCQARADGEWVQLELEDSAPGVPAEALPRLFEPLLRLDEARSRARGGSGLGLAIAEAITRAHGGELSAHASALGGVRVLLALPRQPPRLQPATARPRREA